MHPGTPTSLSLSLSSPSLPYLPHGTNRGEGKKKRQDGGWHGSKHNRVRVKIRSPSMRKSTKVACVPCMGCMQAEGGEGDLRPGRPIGMEAEIGEIENPISRRKSAKGRKQRTIPRKAVLLTARCSSSRRFKRVRRRWQDGKPKSASHRRPPH